MPSVTKFTNQNRQKQLLSAAKAQLKYAYCPYSKDSFAAALLGSDGVIYTGVCVENSDAKVSLCAEHSAVVKAVGRGCKEFLSIAVVSSKGTIAIPCGSCRQVLAEFSPEMAVILQDESGRIHSCLLKDLLPAAFGVKVT